MGQISRGFLGIIAGFIISAASFGVLMSVGFSIIRSGAAFTPENPIVGGLMLFFYLGMIIMFGSPLYFWFIEPGKESLKKLWSSRKEYSEE